MDVKPFFLHSRWRFCIPIASSWGIALKKPAFLTRLISKVRPRCIAFPPDRGINTAPLIGPGDVQDSPPPRLRHTTAERCHSGSLRCRLSRHFYFNSSLSAAPQSESNFWRTLSRSSIYTFCRLLPGSLRVNLLSCNGVQRAPLSIIWSPLYHFMQFPSITFRSVPLCNTAALPFSRSNNALLRNFPQRLSRKISHTPESHIGSTFTH